MRIEKAIYTLGLLSLLTAGAPQKRFPEWRGANLQLYGLWEATPIVAVGNVKNVTKFGQQTVDHLPWPAGPDLHRLYWCQGDFESIATIKGAIDAKKKYVWASANPGCKLFYGDSHDYAKRVARVWFLREEGEFLRPTFDGGTAYFYGFFERRNYAPDLAPQQKLGVLFLTPNANSDTLAEFASNIWGVADVACSLLGKTECVQRITALAKLGNPSLRVAACEYLKAQQDEACEILQ
jgi:hypothetical protein